MARFSRFMRRFSKATLRHSQKSKANNHHKPLTLKPSTIKPIARVRNIAKLCQRASRSRNKYKVGLSIQLSNKRIEATKWGSIAID
jgi:hypothetical protein